MSTAKIEGFLPAGESGTDHMKQPSDDTPTKQQSTQGGQSNDGTPIPVSHAIQDAVRNTPTPSRFTPNGKGGGSPVDVQQQQVELMQRYLPTGLDVNRGTGGNSPPMDEQAWMAQMMGSIWVPNSESPPYPQNNMPMPKNNNAPQPSQAPGNNYYHSMPYGANYQPQQQYDQRGGRGGGGRGFRGGRGRGGSGYHNPNQELYVPVPNYVARDQAHKASHPMSSSAAPFFPGSKPPAFHSPNEQPPHVALVEFKRQRLKKYECGADTPTGEYVIVDGDRGQDCGLVVQVVHTTLEGKTHVQSMDGSELSNHTKLKLENGNVIRTATEADQKRLLEDIAVMEDSALQICRQKCREYGFPFEVLDCEYQFDLKKVSFFFDSEESIDFRNLVRDLYKTFGARIWFENVNRGVKNIVPNGALSAQQKNVYSHFVHTGGRGGHHPQQMEETGLPQGAFTGPQAFTGGYNHRR